MRESVRMSSLQFEQHIADHGNWVVRQFYGVARACYLSRGRCHLRSE
jgi:hypothetical protein